MEETNLARWRSFVLGARMKRKNRFGGSSFKTAVAGNYGVNLDVCAQQSKLAFHSV